MLWAVVAGRPAMCRVSAAAFWPGMLLLLLQPCRVKAAMLLKGVLVYAHCVEAVASSLLAEELCMMAGSELDQLFSFQPEHEGQACLEVAGARSFCLSIVIQCALQLLGHMIDCTWLLSR